MSSPAMPPYPNEFDIASCWTAMQNMLTQQLGEQVDVDCIGAKDFDEQGDLSIRTPAARVLFGSEKAQPFETQKQGYNAEQEFAVLCADEDLSSTQAARLASLQLAGQVKHILTGARLLLADGTLTEPVQYLGTEPINTAGLGIAYVCGFTVPNVAQFAAPNAYPTGGN